jgi:hypothetical protein
VDAVGQGFAPDQLFALTVRQGFESDKAMIPGIPPGFIMRNVTPNPAVVVTPPIMPVPVIVMPLGRVTPVRSAASRGGKGRAPGKGKTQNGCNTNARRARVLIHGTLLHPKFGFSF